MQNDKARAALEASEAAQGQNQSEKTELGDTESDSCTDYSEEAARVNGGSENEKDRNIHKLD